MSMVDITAKTEVYREAEAVGRIRLRRETIERIKRGEIRKGDVITIARTAGILAAKRTPEIIPLTHQIPLTSVSIDIEIRETEIEARARVKTTYKTGVEIEALTAIATTLITIWDMVKEYEKDEEGRYPQTAIEEIRIVRKIKNTNNPSPHG
ncbi:MAG TPA: cyclic pyranopterin monophosphate synthase MoaC [Sulfolobales archaeon]|nr:cyclic pyranopterin monophosphate synthase MoaC [Sulfolobales archaeon]